MMNIEAKQCFFSDIWRLSIFQDTALCLVKQSVVFVAERAIKEVLVMKGGGNV